MRSLRPDGFLARLRWRPRSRDPCNEGCFGWPDPAVNWTSQSSTFCIALQLYTRYCNPILRLLCMSRSTCEVDTTSISCSFQDPAANWTSPLSLFCMVLQLRSRYYNPIPRLICMSRSTFEVDTTSIPCGWDFVGRVLPKQKNIASAVHFIDIDRYPCS